LQAVEIRLEEALDNLKEAVEFYLDNAITAFTSTHKIASTFDVTKPRNELRGIVPRWGSRVGMSADGGGVGDWDMGTRINITQLWGLYFNPIIDHLRPISSPFSSIFPQS